MKAIWNQLGFYLFFVALAIGCLVWGIIAARNSDASVGETAIYFVFAVVWAVLSILTYRYEKRHDLNQ